jgi:hypothetical protein
MNQNEFRGMIGIARADITPPPGIYARCWGAAKHDIAEGIHRPLMLTCVTFQSRADDRPLVLMSLDLMSWRSREDEWFLRGAVLGALSLDESRLMMCLSHTHSAPSVRAEDSEKPGGHFIAAYRNKLKDLAIDAARSALANREPAIVPWRYATCDLARNRDLPEPEGKRLICGFNESGPADDTLLVGSIRDGYGAAIATIVNYACHPTTLGWENKLISPDYVGALREMIESQTGRAPCLFLQGASGELAPAEQYVADTSVADRHGRRVAFAALTALEAIAPPGTKLAYKGVVESGAPLAVWKREISSDPISDRLDAKMISVELELKPMPTAAEFEEQWRRCDEPIQKERIWRKRGVRRVVGDGATTPMPLWVWRVGDAFLVGHSNEAYSLLQTQLRAKFPDRAVAVMNLVNGSAGYLVPRELCGRDSYQTNQTPFAPGSLERVIDAASSAMESMS